MARISYIIRSIEATDHSFLWAMLDRALYVLPGTSPLPKDVIFQPKLAKYVENWGSKEGDRGVIAILADSQTCIGAAWLRMFKSHNPGYGYVDDYTPELSIAVLPEYRGQGIGTKLLTKLFSEVKNCYPAVSLSVSSENPALQLYRRLGFEAIAQYNDSLTMKKHLSQIIN